VHRSLRIPPDRLHTFAFSSKKYVILSVAKDLIFQRILLVDNHITLLNFVYHDSLTGLTEVGSLSFWGGNAVFRELLHAALDLVFPPRQACPLCGGASPKAAVCSECAMLLAGYANERACSCCGSYPSSGNLGVNLINPGQPVLCPDCRSGRPFELARAVGPYEDPLREAVHRLKYYRAGGWPGRWRF